MSAVKKTFKIQQDNSICVRWDDSPSATEIITITISVPPLDNSSASFYDLRRMYRQLWDFIENRVWQTAYATAHDCSGQTFSTNVKVLKRYVSEQSITFLIEHDTSVDV